MAERRMFSKSVILSDQFLSMSVYAQYLYFIFGIYADDDGFVGSPKTIMRQCAIKNSSFDELIQNNYIIPFDSGVIAIKHWKINNYLRNDRHQKTIYSDEFNSLSFDENNAYIQNENDNGIPLVYQRYTQYSIGKVRLGKDSIFPVSDIPKRAKETKHKYGRFKNVLLSDKDIETLKTKFPINYQEKIENLSEGIELKGYKYKNHCLAIIKWAENDKKRNNTRPDLSDPDRYTEDLRL